MKKRISILVPALNEEGNLENTIREIEKGARGNVDNYEIFIVDDGSSDKTGKIADRLAKNNKKITALHNKKSRGMGYSYLKGQKLAKYEYYMYIPGDNQFPGKALTKMLKKLGQADIVIPYVTNMNIRPLPRQIVSHTFTLIVNLLFGLHVKYFNGTVIHKTELLKKVPQKKNSGHAYQAEILVRLIKSGATYVEVGYEMVEREAGETAAFKLSNVKNVFMVILSLFWELQIKRVKPY